MRRDFIKKISALGLLGLNYQLTEHTLSSEIKILEPDPNMAPKKIAFILFDGITWLDFIGIYDPISRLKSMTYLPELSWDLCAFTETVRDNFGLTILPNKIQNELSDYDAIIVPGGFGTRELRYDIDFMSWIKTAEPIKQKISICTGSLLLGSAGFLEGKKATTNFKEYETLAPYCEEVMKERIVQDGNVITAGAVSSSIDLGLYLCELWVGPEAALSIRTNMAYQG
jgi:transcriptional regulator GlxA family with amidase domain